MFLRHFDPSAVNPLLLVNRKRDFDWIVERLSAYLRDPGPHDGLGFCVSGDKGSGKSILTRSAIRALRKDFSDRALFLEINCREGHSAKAVFGVIASAIVEGLDGLRSAGLKVSRELLANAQILATITGFDEAELKVVHEHLEQHKLALGLTGARALLDVLNISFGISLERSSKTVKELAGKVRFDERRLGKAVAALFRDIREAGIDVVLYLDNLDELRHTYRTAEERERVRLDVDALLLLREAPIGLVVNVRTYFSGILPREIVNRRVLRRMNDGELLEILKIRLDGELEEVKTHFGVAAFRAEAEKLAGIAPTPLALLQWFKFLFEEERIAPGEMKAGLEDYLATNYTRLRAEVLEKVAAAFEDLNTPLSRAAVLAACGNNEAVLNQLQDRQAILPGDFWNPVEFTLDPELSFLHPQHRL
jgi:Cdc6-like AAA superfamily ATPase